MLTAPAAIRRLLTYKRGLAWSTQEELIEDTDPQVLLGWVLNQRNLPSERLERRLLERMRAGEVDDVTSVMFFRAVRSPSVQIDLALRPVSSLTRFMLASNEHLQDPAAWQTLLDGAACAGHIDHAQVLDSVVKRTDLPILPPLVALHLFAYGHLSVWRALGDRDDFALTNETPVPVLSASSRGCRLLDSLAPTDRGTWDILLPDWEGSAESLRIACTNLGPEP